MNKREKDKLYYLRNRKRIKEKKKQYYLKNKSKTIRRNQLWRKENPIRYKESNRKRHDLEMFGGNKPLVLERDNFECQGCGMTQEQHIITYGYGLIVHHIDGKGKGFISPNNNLDNLIALCRRCHTSHHNKERIGNKHPNFKHGRFVRKVSKNSKKDKELEKLKAEHQKKLNKLGKEFENESKKIEAKYE